VTVTESFAGGAIYWDDASLVLASLKGDFNGNGVLDAADIDDLTSKSASMTNPIEYDLNNDTFVDSADVQLWVRDLFYSWIGDANLDGVFDSFDLIEVLAASTYEKEVPAVWTTGDFDGNGRFASNDLIDALADAGYEQGPRMDVAAVPEPSSVSLLCIGALLAVAPRRRTSRGKATL